MSRPKLRVAHPVEDAAAETETGQPRLEMPAPELERARTAYRGAIEAARAWRQFSPNPRHHDATYWNLFISLFVDPGMNRTQLIDRVMDGAGVSRSTAERAIKDARDSGLIVYEQSGAEVRLDLSDRMFNHCVDYFRGTMDRDKLNKRFGYDDGYAG